MPVSLFFPSPRLARFISCYYFVEETTPEHLVPKRRVPDGTPELVFHFRGPFYKTDGDGKKELIRQKCLLQGQMTTLMKVEAVETIGFLGVKFRPEGFRHFVTGNVSQFTNQLTDIRDVWGSAASALEDKLYATENLEERIGLLETFLSGLISSIPDPRTEHCVQRILDSKGMIKMAELAQSVNLGVRQLERKFLETVGVSPGSFARMIKMQSVLRDIERDAPASLTQLGLEYGYYDQSHFIKEVAIFTGTTPKVLRQTDSCLGQTPYF